LIKILDGIKKVSEWSNIPSSTIFDYIKSGKLYKINIILMSYKPEI